MPPSSAFVALNLRSVLTHVGVGMGAASFWRGAWYILDDHLFPNDPMKSAVTSLGMGTLGMALSQGLIHKVEILAAQKSAQKAAASAVSNTTSKTMIWKIMAPLKIARFGALYTIALSCVLVWRGTWLGWDVLYEYSHPEQHFCEQTNLKRINSTDPGHATASGFVSHVLAVSALVGTGLFASVLAPPAATGVIRDFTIKAGSKSYAGAGQKLWNQMFSSSSGGTASTSTSLGASYSTSAKAGIINPTNQASTILARNYQTKPVMSRLCKTQRIATSIHEP